MDELKLLLGERPPEWAIVIIPLLAFMESCAGIGLFISGILLLTVATLLHSQDFADPMLMAGLAFFGAALGDQTGFLVGRLYGSNIWNIQFLKRRSSSKEKFEKLMIQNAPWAIFIGRFIPAVRSITPILAGLANITAKRFLAYDLVACSFWAFGLYLLVVGLGSISYLSFLNF